MTALALSGVTLALGGREVLSGVSFAVPDGAFVGVLGPNGAGKTTLMRAVLGLLRPVRGTVSVFGAPARRGNPAIGYLPQARGSTAGLRLRGYDLVAAAVSGHRFGLTLGGAAERREVDWALDLVGGTALAERPLGELSGGERQRLLLAQALLGRPELLLLDEPLASLDPRHQHGVVTLVREIQQHLKLTVLFSAHDLNAVLGVLDQVLYLGGGQAALGTVDAVVTAPVLSRLYGASIDVARIGGRIFVVAGGQTVGCAHEHAPLAAG